MHRFLLALTAGLVLALPVYAAPDSATYQYDNLGRLIKIIFANGTTVTYNYDAMGNRTSVVIVCSPTGC